MPGDNCIESLSLLVRLGFVEIRARESSSLLRIRVTTVME